MGEVEGGGAEGKGLRRGTYGKRKETHSGDDNIINQNMRLSRQAANHSNSTSLCSPAAQLRPGLHNSSLEALLGAECWALDAT